MADGTREAVLAGGCFWCLEAVYEQLRGVVAVKSGYAGGHVEHPRYREVCTGTTGHAEAVRVTYDPEAISYEDLLRVFFTVHDPTQLDRQGDDVGSQYRSAIFVADAAEAARAASVRDEASALWDGEVVTGIVAGAAFWPAEEEHDSYFVNHPESGYCQMVVAPKVAKFRREHVARLKG